MPRRASAEGPPDGDPGQNGARAPIAVRLDDLLTDRGMTLTELAERVGITIVNLSILKNGRARAIRFTTLASLCQVLDCQPGDLLSYQPDGRWRDGAPPQ
jgi:putative transcriptional regulator